MHRSLLQRLRDFLQPHSGYGHKSMADHGLTVFAAKLQITTVLVGVLVAVGILMYRAFT